MSLYSVHLIITQTAFMMMCASIGYYLNWDNGASAGLAIGAGLVWLAHVVFFNVKPH